MRALATLALGLVVVLLYATYGGWDLLPDPVGWALVLLGLNALRGHPRHGRLVALAALALAVSVGLWLPGAGDALYDVHPSLAWAATLPQLGFCALLADTLADLCADAGERRLRVWFRVAVTGFVVAAVLPVLVLGVGVDGLADVAYAVASASLLLLVVLLVSCSRRTWPEPADSPSPADAAP